MFNNGIFNDIISNQLSEDERRRYDLQIQTQLSRQLFVRIEIINEENNIISEVSGSAIGGNYNIDSSALLRRTCSVTFNLESGYLPTDNNSKFWINKKFKLYIGLRQGNTNNIYWFDKGTYAIKDPNVSISVTEQTITVNGLDKMALHNGDISGQLEYNTVIEVAKDTFVHNAVEAIMRDGGETKLRIAETSLVVPYQIESAIGDVRCDIITKLTDLFYNYQAYYDIDGTFVFDTKPAYMSNGTSVENDIVMDFSETYAHNTLMDLSGTYTNSTLQTIPHNLIISISRDVAYSNVKNRIVVYGGVHDDGYQPSYSIDVTDKTHPDSPYTLEKLNEWYNGNRIYRTLVIQDDTYVDDGVATSETDDMTKVHAYSINLCKERAKQEVYLHQQATDTITITCLPIYSLDVNEVIYMNDSKSGVNGEYVINNISCGLGANDTMTITANKLW